jgi:Tol biopolymer transport system component
MRWSTGRRVSVFLCSWVLLAASASPLPAQYFGRNKVQYEDLHFKVLKTEHFDVYYYPDEAAAAQQAGRMAERWYGRLSTILDHKLSGRQPIVLYATMPQFQQTNVVGGIGEGTGGVTEALMRRIVLPTGGTLTDMDHVIGHELVHAFQYDITGRGTPTSLGALPAAAALPLWFIEGMAEYLSIGPVSPFTAMWMRGSLVDSLPSYRDLENPRYFPYRYGQALLAYIGGVWGDRIMGDLLRTSARTRDVGRAIQTVLVLTPDALVARWHDATRAAYQPLLAKSQPAESVGTRIIAVSGDDAGGRYNVSPSVSPEGERLMFLSDRDLFSIDLFLADARSGKVEHRVTNTAVDPHLTSLQFLASAGSWDATGTRFTYSGISDGRPLLVIYDVVHRRVSRKIPLKTLGEVLNPSWSPDGTSIVFSAIIGGLTDLYVYDLETDELRRLTNDQFADLQPAWSPDGRSIAFATDRFTTDPESLRLGPYSLALFDLGTGKVTRVPGFSGARHINPQWAPDGTALYFLSDPLGVTNVYRVQLGDGALTQITDLYTGASGITESSPALSVAQRSGRIVFSLFRARGYEIYGIDSPSALAGRPLIRTEPGQPGVLPPQDRSGSVLLATLSNEAKGLPSQEEFTDTPYRSGLKLTYVGQPSLLIGSSGFGTYVGGGASLYFSDVLGDHNLVTGLQVQGSLKDLSAAVGYQNTKKRLNWTVVAQQQPYVTGGFASGTTTVDGEPVFVDQQLIQRQTDRDVHGILSYPFNQAQRVELGAGFSHISFDNELRTFAVSAVTGETVIDETEDLPPGDPLALGSGTAALVFDNALFGATAPILGQRYRLEVDPTFGSLNFVGVLADYRRYFLPVRPFTVAARILHYGRYGSGGEDQRLQPLFLGSTGLVRGYDFNSFDVTECHPAAGDPNSCPVFDQLLGSRLLIGNLELRFPLFGLLGAGSGYYGILPLDWLVFADGGVAWDSQNEPSFTGGNRDAVFSAGTGFRFNLFGFAVAEVDLIKPFDRPDKGWVWEFHFLPGF